MKSSAIENIAYYKQQIQKNEQVWLTTKSEKDRKILAKQVETFRKLQLRYKTIAAKQFVKENQLLIF